MTKLRKPPELREIGSTGIFVSPVAMGCWPIAGMTSLDVNERDSLATLHSALEIGINFFDTAYCYGLDGLSERLIAQATAKVRDQIVIATKCGLHWTSPTDRLADSDPKRLRAECEESLRRLNTDHVELLYLHCPDERRPIADAAETLRMLQKEGKTRSIGASNFTLEQLREFHAACPLAAYQPPYNMLQREIEADILPFCREQGISTIVYWPLMKGLLTGKLNRDFQFRPGDGRAKYPMYQGEEWLRNMDFVDRLRNIATRLGKTVAQLTVNWTVHQPGITVALCGAKRPHQIEETAGAMGWEIPSDAMEEIAEALRLRGTAVTRGAV